MKDEIGGNLKNKIEKGEINHKPDSEIANRAAAAAEEAEAVEERARGRRRKEGSKINPPRIFGL